jgi:ribosomal protein L12E/L44/L45/RPP1/RPP2
MSRKRSHSASTRDETIILRSKPKNVHKTFVVGDKVQAQWKDKRWYEAKVIKVDKKDGTFTVRFLEDKIVREGLTTGQVRYVTKKETLALFDNLASEEEESEEKEETESEEEESEDTEDSSLVITRKSTRKNDIVAMNSPPTPSKLKQAIAPKKTTAVKNGKDSINNSPTNNNNTRTLRNASPSPPKKVSVLIEVHKEKANTSSIGATRQTASAQKEKPKTKATPVSTPQRSLRSGSTPQKGSNKKNNTKKNNKNSEEESDDGDEDHVEAEEESSGVSEQIMQTRTYMFTVKLPVERALKSYTFKSEITPRVYQRFVVPMMQEISKID